MGSVMRSSCARVSPRMFCEGSKKWRMKVRTALGSDAGRNGRRRNGCPRAATKLRLATAQLGCHAI